MSKKGLFCTTIAIFLFFCCSISLSGDDGLGVIRDAINSSLGTPQGEHTPNLVTEAIVLSSLTLLPFIVMLLSSFIKMIIVMSLLKNAMGTAQIPPSQVTNGVAIILTIYVMSPTGLGMYKESKKVIEAKEWQQKIMKRNYGKEEVIKMSDFPEDMEKLLETNLQDPMNFLIKVVEYAKEPLKGFLQRNTLVKHKNHFYKIAMLSFPKEFHEMITPEHFLIILPSYITSQLQLAFEIGVLIYLPFFIIDLVTSNVLLAMGMMMLSPMTISAPLKLLLLVSIDGWTLLVKGLTQTFH